MHDSAPFGFFAFVELTAEGRPFAVRLLCALGIYVLENFDGLTFGTPAVEKFQKSGIPATETSMDHSAHHNLAVGTGTRRFIFATRRRDLAE